VKDRVSVADEANAFVLVDVRGKWPKLISLAVIGYGNRLQA